jgi:hypothetical protein
MSNEQSINTLRYAFYVKLAPPSAVAVIKKLNDADYAFMPKKFITN